MKYRSTNEDAWGLEFGKNLQSKIKDSGLTQGEIADRVDVSRQVFSRYIHGRTIPSLYKAKQIAKELGCTVDDLTNVSG